MQELTRFGMKNSSTLPSLANEYFNSLRDEKNEPIHTYNDEFMRNFVRQSNKSGRCGSFSQYYNSSISDEVFNNISKELNLSDNKSEVLDKNFEYANKQGKKIENEYDSQFDDYRHIDQEERTKHINRKRSKLPIQEQLQKLNLINLMMHFDATSLYASAMNDENSRYPKIETGFAFKPHMNKTYVDAFNNQTFNQDGDESSLRIENYNPPNLIFQHLPVKQKIKIIEVNRMRNGYIFDTINSINSVDICEIV